MNKKLDEKICPDSGMVLNFYLYISFSVLLICKTVYIEFLSHIVSYYLLHYSILHPSHQSLTAESERKKLEPARVIILGVEFTGSIKCFDFVLARKNCADVQEQARNFFYRTSL